MTSQLPSIDFSAYHSAIVRIATLREPGRSERPHLLFASVELITPSRPVPDSMRVNAKGVPQVHSASSIGIDLAFRRVSMRAAEAVTWYRSLQSAPSLPIPVADADRGRHDGTAIQASSLADEPAWPFLSTPLADPSLFGSGDDFYPTPFTGPGSHPARAHRQLAVLTPQLERVLGDEKARRWLLRRVHFDIARHDELLGGAVLVVPDPDVRIVRSSMARDAAGREHMVGEVRPRLHRSLRGLTLTLFEERFGAMNLFKSFEVRDALMIAPASDQIEHAGHALSHTERGLIDQQKALPYLRTIGFNMGLTKRRVRLETRDDRRKGSKPTVHDLSETDWSTNSVVELHPDLPRSRDAASRFYASSQRRHAERLAHRQQVQWFDQRSVALRFIREQIARAKETVMIVDPYADGLDLFNFGHFIGRSDVTLRLLTSRLPFRNAENARAGFAEVLRTFRERGLPQPEIRILAGGQNPPIHDRFLVVDGDVWLSGNSLNKIGERASVMLKLIDPAEAHTRLQRLFDTAEGLDLGEMKP